MQKNLKKALSFVLVMVGNKYPYGVFTKKYFVCRRLSFYWIYDRKACYMAVISFVIYDIINGISYAKY